MSKKQLRFHCIVNSIQRMLNYSREGKPVIANTKKGCKPVCHIYITDLMKWCSVQIRVFLPGSLFLSITALTGLLKALNFSPILTV